ncbi:MAG: VWA domain-containing protein [Planctomycetota bacterium]|nr:VWA domain-containing protein [Planctomycetota bacterium]
MTALRMAFLLTLPVLLPAGSTPGPGRNQPVPIDVVLAIDSSLSLHRSDPTGFGREAAHDIADFLLPGDRIGVVRFAGWDETVRRGAIVFPIAEIPDTARERRRFLDRYSTTLDNGLGEFGRGTDFNVAFQEGVFRMFGGPEAMGKDRPVWIILYTDGGMDVVEGERTRQRYITESGRVSPQREDLNRSALSIMRREVIPHIEKRDVTLTILYPSDLRPEQRVSPLPSRFPRSTGKEREDLFWLLEQMGSSGSGRGSAKIVSARAPMLHPFRIPQGVGSSQVLVFGDSTEFKVDVVGPAGTSLVADGTVIQKQRGRLYRVYEISAPAAGDYLLTVSTDSDRPSRFIARHTYQYNVGLFLRIPDTRQTYHAGEILRIEAGLQDASNGTPITDPDMLRRFEGAILIRDPSGGAERIALRKGLRGPAEIDFPLSETATPGRYRLSLSGRLDSADPESADLPPIEAEFSLRGLVSIEFEQPTAFEGQLARIVGKAPKGSASLDGAVGIVSGDDGSPEIEVPLTVDGGRVKGSKLLKMGRWKIRGKPTTWLDVEAGEVDMITIAARTLTAYALSPGAVSIPADPPSKLAFEPESDGRHAGTVGLRFDLLPGETGTLRATLLDQKGQDVGKILLDGEEEIILSGNQPERILQVQFEGSPVGGNIEFRAVLATFEARRSLLPKWRPAAVATQGEPNRQAVLIAAASAMALLLALGVYRIASIPKFTEQRLWYLGDDRTEEHLLRDMKRGFFGNRAIGTPEVPLSVELLLRSRNQAKEGRCLLKPLVPTDQVYVNHFAIAGPLELKDGAEIILERDGFPCRYMYYAKHPGPQGEGAVTEDSPTRVDGAPTADEMTEVAELKEETKTSYQKGDTDRIPRPEDETQIE